VDLVANFARLYSKLPRWLVSTARCRWDRVWIRRLLMSRGSGGGIKAARAWEGAKQTYMLGVGFSLLGNSSGCASY
jgi:hypothetical protein